MTCPAAHNEHTCTGTNCLRAALAVFEQADTRRAESREVDEWLIWPHDKRWMAERCEQREAA